jgi:hypothetical protein
MAVDMRLVADDLQRIAAPLNEANAIVPQYSHASRDVH